MISLRRAPLLFALVVATRASAQVDPCPNPVSASQIVINYAGALSNCSVPNTGRPCVAGEQVTFSVTSNVTDHCLLAYQWTMPDGTTVIGPSATFTFTSTDSFPVLLTVASNKNTVQVTRNVHPGSGFLRVGSAFGGNDRSRRRAAAIMTNAVGSKTKRPPHGGLCVMAIGCGGGI